jgi:hypothetical protein
MSAKGARLKQASSAKRATRGDDAMKCMHTSHQHDAPKSGTAATLECVSTAERRAART